ncbi:MAG: SDR family oxidoreductase [Luminiphilus sp.]|nr:SDR family oxidoreductase [Luminiphilus sp.]
MAHYLVTGAATGIGRAIKETLLAQSHQVSTLDIRDADFQCDLSDPALRDATLSALAGQQIFFDGIVTCAGVASHFPDITAIPAINFFGSVRVVEALLDRLSPGARILAISSNSAPQSRNTALVAAMLEDDEQTTGRLSGEGSGHEAYAASKLAIARWVRKRAPELATRGITINAIAPGYIETPMTQAVAQSKEYGDAIRDFVDSIPIGRSGQPEDVAQLAQFLLSPAAGFMTGNVVFIDGGHDALFRPESV